MPRQVPRLAGLQPAPWLMVCLMGAALGIACSDSPAGPTASTPVTTPTAPATVDVTGSLVDGVTGSPVEGALVVIDGLGQAASAANGAFVISTTQPSAVRRISVTSARTVERVAWVVAPGPSPVVSVMPATLSADAFEQMYRSSGGVLRRWVTQPALVVERRVLRFTNTTDTSYVGVSATLSPGDADGIVEDLGRALPQLTGGRFPAFSSVSVPLAGEGNAVVVRQPGTIVVGRYEGLRQATGFIGYGRWFWEADGAIRAGIVMLDLGWDTSTSIDRRPTRWHELGHALGYNHVTSPVSVMTPSAQSPVTVFDQDSARLAFARPIFNRFPDADPEPLAGTVASRETAGAGGAP